MPRNETLHCEFEEPQKNKNHLRKKIVKSATAIVFLAGSMSLMSRDVAKPDRFLVNHGDAPHAEDEFTILQANVRKWISLEGENNFEDFKKMVKQSGADAVCMQEVVDGPEVRELARTYNVLFAATKSNFYGRRFGNMLISTSPIDLVEIIDLPTPYTDEPRRAVVGSIETEFGDLDVGVIHFSTNTLESVIQTRHFENSQVTKPKFTCGDTNRENPTESGGGFGRSVVHGAFSGYSLASSHEPTFPDYGSGPVYAFDHILSSCHSYEDLFKIRESTTLHSFKSDHYGVSVNFSLKNCFSNWYSVN